MREDRRPLRILLAEDNPVNQMVAVRLLEKMGHTVMVVANGRDAVLMAGEQEFGLVLMDVQMPEMGGFEATRLIREKETGNHQKHTPIIAMTAHAMKGDREQCLAVGMDGYVAKPIRQAELLAEIERFTRGPEPAPQKALHPPPGMTASTGRRPGQTWKEIVTCCVSWHFCFWTTFPSRWKPSTAPPTRCRRMTWSASPID